MLKSIVVTLIVVVLGSSCAFAGEIFGTLIDGNKPVAAGVKLVIKAGEKSYTGETDKFGAYRIFVNEKGKGILTVQVKDQTVSVELFSYDRSTRYDWVIEMKDGKPVLRRK